MYNVHSGVPQGSIIGPLLFLIYINDITDCATSLGGEGGISLFADDTKLYSTNPIKLQHSLTQMDDWLLNRQLKLAPDKCLLLSINKPSFNTGNDYYINQTKILAKPFIKDLGILIQSDLKWNHHINFIYKQASARSYQILKAFKSKNIWTLLKLFLVYVRPKVEYNTPLWSPYLEKDKTKIERVQRHFTRAACLRCGVPFSSYEDRLVKLNISSLETRRIRYDLILIYKIIYGLSDLQFSNYFVYHSPPYNFRGHQLKIQPIKLFKSTQWQNTFFVRAPRYWNSLPQDVVTCINLNLFKNKLDKVNLNSLLS